MYKFLQQIPEAVIYKIITNLSLIEVDFLGFISLGKMYANGRRGHVKSHKIYC